MAVQRVFTFLVLMVMARCGVLAIQTPVDSMMALAKTLENQVRSREALALCEKIRNRCSEGGFSEEVQMCNYIIMGNAYLDLRQLDSSEYFSQRSLELSSKVEQAPKWVIQSIHSNLGWVNCERGNYELSEVYFEKLLQDFRNSSPSELETAYKIKALGQIAMVNGRRGDMEYAKKYMFEAQRIAEAELDPLDPNMASLYNNLSILLWQGVGDLDQAQTYAQKAIHIKEKNLGRDHVSLISSLGNLAAIYRQLGACSKAKQTYDRIVSIARKNPSLSMAMMAQVYKNIGMFNMGCGYRDEAKEWLDRALENYQISFGMKHPEIGSTYGMLAEWAITQGDDCLALDYLDLQSEALGYIGGEAETFSQISNWTIFESYLWLKIKILRRLQFDDPSYGKMLEGHYDLVLQFYDYRQQETPIQSKSQGIDIYLSVFEGYINFLLSQDVRDYERVFMVFEKVKNLSLWRDFKKINVDFSEQMPDSLQEKNQRINEELSKVEKELYEMKYQVGHKVSGDEIKTKEDTRLSLMLAQEEMMKLMKRNYPNYYHFLFNDEVIPLSEYMASLKDDESVISYFVGDSSIFYLVIDHEEVVVHAIDKDFDLEGWVDSLRIGIYGYWSAPDQSSAVRNDRNQMYADKAYALYQKLIAPAKRRLKRRLTIIPDGPLCLLPMEALLTKAVRTIRNYKEYSFLLYDHTISYVYSATLQNKLAETANLAPKGLLAVAPEFKRMGKDAYEAKNYEQVRFQAGPLKYNLQEARQIAEIFDGDTLLAEKASKSNFLGRAGDYRVLHLSTHAKANSKMGEYSYLMFSAEADSLDDGKLYVSELKSQKMNADLIVLSACETGLGDLKRGEGVNGLANGAFYAGTRSTLVSLWSVNDLATSTLLVDFYEGIRKGRPKDEALRAAKLKYLNEASVIDPFFWASFVAMGNMHPLILEPSGRRRNIGWLLVMVCVLGFLIFWRVKQLE